MVWQNIKIEKQKKKEGAMQEKSQEIEICPSAYWWIK
jgi:hypothetical protein